MAQSLSNEGRVTCSGRTLPEVHVGSNAGAQGTGPNPEKMGRGGLPGRGSARLEFCRGWEELASWKHLPSVANSDVTAVS